MMYMLFIILFLICLIWYLRRRCLWYQNVISRNPKKVTLHPVLTKSMEMSDEFTELKYPSPKVIAPYCTFKQYIRYLYLSCIPYGWSVPIKFSLEMISRLSSSKLNETQKRERLAKMVLETSLVLGFVDAQVIGVYIFQYENFRLPAKVKDGNDYYHVDRCTVEIAKHKGATILEKLIINKETVTSLDEMFAILNTIWCVYTHTMTHIQAGNIAEINLSEIQNHGYINAEFKKTVDDMHAAVAGMNESANHYPADIWGISRKNLQIILGFNSTQKIRNHQNIIKCYEISNFIRFSMKARTIFRKHLKFSNAVVSALTANTIFHSIDHYNMGKYFLHESKEKKFKGIDARMITSILGDLNYDIGCWQGMKYSKCQTWRSIYQELRDIDKELADRSHMFVSV